MQTLRIAFTSCARWQPGLAQPVWSHIQAADPDLLVLLGDQVYMDFGLWPFAPEPQRAPRRYSVAQFAATLRAKYERQWAQPEFAALLRHMRVKGGLMGVWDDHDFAWNNAYGADPTEPDWVHLAAKADVSRALFHEFMACAPQPPLLYDWRDWPAARVIVLDNRSYATPLSVQPPVLMGGMQMDWLARALRHDAPYTVVCGGLTLNRSAENWSRYTDEYARFSALVGAAPRPLYLGGDIHKNAFDPVRTGVPCYQIVSSGAAVNVLGLPFEWDRRRNWSLLTLQTDGVTIDQHDKHGVQRWAIDAATWAWRALAPEKR